MTCRVGVARDAELVDLGDGKFFDDCNLSIRDDVVIDDDAWMQMNHLLP